MEKLNFIIAKNLTDLRKKNKLTQMELAEKLNYSDKAVSKWEQGESMPGIEVLYKLSKLYNVSLDFIVGEATVGPEKITTAALKKKHRIIALLSVLAVWSIATVIYVIFDIFYGGKLWSVFCWAFPTSMIVAIVFDVLWGEKKALFIFISLLFWSLLICICLQFLQHNVWIILAIGVPLQIATVLWSRLIK